MPLTKAKKAEQVEMLAKELKGSTTAIVGTFAKLTVTQDFQLRKAVRGAGGSYRVVKNKLAARASQGTGVEAALQGLKGVSSVAYTSGDPVALAKALSTWVKDNAEFTFKMGIVDGKVLTVVQIGELATMPSKEEIYAKLLYLISSPAQRLATVIAATGRDLAVVINQAVEQGKFAGPAASAAVDEIAPAEAVAEVPEPVVAIAAAEPVAKTAPAEPSVPAQESVAPHSAEPAPEPVTAEATSAVQAAAPVSENAPVLAPVALAAAAVAAVAFAPVAAAAAAVAAVAAGAVALAAGTGHPAAGEPAAGHPEEPVKEPALPGEAVKEPVAPAPEETVKEPVPEDPSPS